MPTHHFSASRRWRETEPVVVNSASGVSIGKLRFLISEGGTGYIYETVLRPFVTNHETDLEKKLPEWRAKAWDLAIYYLQNCSDLGQSAIFQVLEYTAGQSGKSSKSSNKARLALYSFCPLD
ncbi:hypothetical protein SAY86_027442 [Trapa natans]|uniref:Uncharacterized protein n=1 Tax=Trapa natans TaxID=22666 RepID=A0AAN7QIV6_TRANT|nr:hypothetical protein SAY86_027442 [Trapa natans]